MPDGRGGHAGGDSSRCQQSRVLPDIVSSDCGEVFEAGNAESLAAAIIRILSRPDYAEVCKTVRREAEAKYSEEANYGRMMEIYEAVRK